MLLNGMKHIGEFDLGGKRVSMINDWHPIRAVPTVHWGAT